MSGPASSIACCHEYHNLATAMQAAGYVFFPCSSSAPGAAADVSQSRGSQPSTTAESGNLQQGSLGKADPSTAGSHSRAACLARARAPLLRLVAQGACHIRLRLPLLAACIPLLEAAPPALQHADLHALLAALEVGTRPLLRLSIALIWSAGWHWCAQRHATTDNNKICLQQLIVRSQPGIFDLRWTGSCMSANASSAMHWPMHAFLAIPA